MRRIDNGDNGDVEVEICWEVIDNGDVEVEICWEVIDNGDVEVVMLRSDW